MGSFASLSCLSAWTSDGDQYRSFYSYWFSITFLSLRQQPPTAGSIQIPGQGAQASAADALWDGCLLGKWSLSSLCKPHSRGGEVLLAEFPASFSTCQTTSTHWVAALVEWRAQRWATQPLSRWRSEVLLSLIPVVQLFRFFLGTSVIYLEIMHIFVCSLALWFCERKKRIEEWESNGPLRLPEGITKQFCHISAELARSKAHKTWHVYPPSLIPVVLHVRIQTTRPVQQRTPIRPLSDMLKSDSKTQTSL